MPLLNAWLDRSCARRWRHTCHRLPGSREVHIYQSSTEYHLSDAEVISNGNSPWKVVPVVISLTKTEGVSNVLRLSVRRLAETLLEESKPLVERALSRALLLDKPVDGMPVLEDERELLNWARTCALWVGTQQDAHVVSTGGLRAGVGFRFGELVERSFWSGGPTSMQARSGRRNSTKPWSCWTTTRIMRRMISFV